MASLAKLGNERLARARGIRADLPLYVTIGGSDTPTDGARLSDLQVQRYRDARLIDITYRVYPNARHEPLNEINRGDARIRRVGCPP